MGKRVCVCDAVTPVSRSECFAAAPAFKPALTGAPRGTHPALPTVLSTSPPRRYQKVTLKAFAKSPHKVHFTPPQSMT